MNLFSHKKSVALVLTAGSRRCFDALPVRFASIHQCLERTLFSEMVHSITLLMMRGGLRLQLHLENCMEVKYKLMSFGIPVDSKSSMH